MWLEAERRGAGGTQSWGWLGSWAVSTKKQSRRWAHELDLSPSLGKGSELRMELTDGRGDRGLDDVKEHVL